MELVRRGFAARLPCRCGVERINVIGFGDRYDHRPIRAALDVKWLGVNIAGDRAVKVQVTRQVCCRGRRKRSVNVNAVPGRIVVFLCDVDLRVSLDATQHGKAENRNYRSQLYAVSRHLGMRVRSSPSRYLNTFECPRCTRGTCKCHGHGYRWNRCRNRRSTC